MSKNKKNKAKKTKSDIVIDEPKKNKKTKASKKAKKDSKAASAEKCENVAENAAASFDESKAENPQPSPAAEKRVYDISSHDYYLDLADIPANEYGVNFTYIDDTRRDDWARQREKYGFDEREIWNMDSQFLQWVYSRTMFFLDNGLAGDVSVEFEGKEYMQEEFLREMCEDALFCIKNQYSTEIPMQEVVSKMIRVGHMWAEILPAMWF